MAGTAYVSYAKGFARVEMWWNIECDDASVGLRQKRQLQDTGAKPRWERPVQHDRSAFGALTQRRALSLCVGLVCDDTLRSTGSITTLAASLMPLLDPRPTPSKATNPRPQGGTNAKVWNGRGGEEPDAREGWREGAREAGFEMKKARARSREAKPKQKGGGNFWWLYVSGTNTI